ncbi:hypothetical protein GJV52_10480 [Neisseria brasiliensis]|nr:hypothetical protein GJV52_10480 [Neisseria brasiliensis]
MNQNRKIIFIYNSLIEFRQRPKRRSHLLSLPFISFLLMCVCLGVAMFATPFFLAFIL